MDKAILPDWNDFTKRSEITIPPGGLGTFYEGITAPQGLGFVGGTGQIYIREEVLESKLFQSLVKEGPFK